MKGNTTYENYYFLGIGGIGMSALARYFIYEGRRVAGYDRTSTPLTLQLAEEGAAIHYDDSAESIPLGFRDPDKTLVVYTPAIPADSAELYWFKSSGFEIVKRSEMLGWLSEGKYVMAVAGTHGKTTVTTMIAWLNSQASAEGAGGADPGSAFLGGIATNFNSNLVLAPGKRLAVEADEFDRSFLKLHPDIAVITSTDADHLDIYGTHEAMIEAFTKFAGQIKEGGTLILKKGIGLNTRSSLKVYSYSYDSPCDFYALNITPTAGGYYRFDIHCPDRIIYGCTLGVPGWINIENAIAAVAQLWVAGFDEERLRNALSSFRGVKRRFEFYINTPQVVYMDDYAHHPRELTAAIGSVKAMFPGRRLTAIFQPHLYTRTKDHYKGFAEALSMADDVILIPIYPAREKPIDGIDSELIGRYLTVPYIISDKEDVATRLSERDNDVVATFGAGDIDKHCAQIAEVLSKKK